MCATSAVKSELSMRASEHTHPSCEHDAMLTRACSLAMYDALVFSVGKCTLVLACLQTFRPGIGVVLECDITTCATQAYDC